MGRERCLSANLSSKDTEEVEQGELEFVKMVSIVLPRKSRRLVPESIRVQCRASSHCDHAGTSLVLLKGCPRKAVLGV